MKNKRPIKAIFYETTMFIVATIITWIYLGRFGESLPLTIIITIVKIPLFCLNDKIWSKNEKFN